MNEGNACGETLYSLSSAFRTAIEGGFVFDEETGEIFWEPDDLDAIDAALSVKAESVLAVQREYASKANAVDAEIKRLQALKKAYNGHSERLKSYLSACVDAAGKPIETTVGRISKRKSKAVQIIDAAKIPDDYMRYKDPEPDKVLIKKAIEGGTAVPGASLVLNESLQIR